MRLLKVILSALLMSVPIAASAAVTGVSVSPDPIVVNASGSALARVNWTVEVTTSVPATLESLSGAIVGGTSTETPGRRLERRITTSGVSTYRFSERIRISRSAIQALRSGATVFYSRDWNDGGGPVNQVVALQLGSGGELTIQDASLRFSDRSRYAIVDQGEALTAVARLTTVGRGRFEGTWQVSGPDGATSGAFRPIGRARQMLAGSRSTVFESKKLPTDRPGIYRVRLLPSPSAGADTASMFPELTYYVLPGTGPGALELGRPAAGADVAAGTQFSWSAVRGAAVYRLEFLADIRIAAVDVAAPATRTGLRSFTLRRLQRQGATSWRVVAFDGDGRILAASQARRIGGGAALGSNR